MFKLVQELFSLLTTSQKKRFYYLQVLVVIMAFLELIGVVSIAPFMALVGDPTILQRDNIASKIYLASGLSSPNDFIYLLGFAVLCTLAFAAIISMYTSWRLFMFATNVGAEIADRLFGHYLRQNWLFHVMGSTSQLTKKISNESTRVTNMVILSLMQMNSRIAVAGLLSLGIFIYNPMVAIVGLSLFATAYLILFQSIRLRLEQNGNAISNILAQRYQLMNESFGGIKDALLLGRTEDFKNSFSEMGKRLAYSEGTINAIAQVPKYFMELVAFGTIISLILYLVKTHQGDLGLILPILSVYSLAGMKLIPAFQHIYFCIAQIKGNISAFESIKQDLYDSKEFLVNKFDIQSVKSLSPMKSINLENISFTYPGKDELTLNKLNICIQVNSVVGIVGPSGSGKSTAIDVLLGLIEPQEGKLIVDGYLITDSNRRDWQNAIGFVPQSIFLSEGTIAENVAFGIPKGLINYDQVGRAVKLAHLDGLVDSLEHGINTKVGERGVQLSGGQRQRIGIARALYHEANVLIFDEATSALDGITEKMIMEAIHDFSGQKTIIMIAHRLKTVEKCDKIFFIDKGQVIDQGTYYELIKTNAQFKKMASHT